MSRTFNGSQALYRSGLNVVATPMTIAAWVKTATTSGFGKTIAAGATGSTNYHRIGQLVSTSRWFLQSYDTVTATPNLLSTTVPSTSAWVHVCGVFASTTSRTLYINGVQEGSTDTTSCAPANFTHMGFGAKVYTSGGTDSLFEGSLRDVVFWTVGLSGTQVASIASGASPLLFQPGDMALFAPCVGAAALPEINLRGPTLTSFGSPTKGTSDPRLYLP